MPSLGRGGKAVGSFTIETEPWQWQDYTLDIPHPIDGQMEITLEFDQRFKDENG